MNRIQERGIGYEISNSLVGCFIALTLLVDRIKDVFYKYLGCCGNLYLATDSE